MNKRRNQSSPPTKYLYTYRSCQREVDYRGFNAAVTYAIYDYPANQRTLTSNYSPDTTSTLQTTTSTKELPRSKHSNRVVNLRTNKNKCLLESGCWIQKYLRTQLWARELNPDEHSYEEALTGWDSSESLLIYSISLISLLIAGLDLVDIYLMLQGLHLLIWLSSTGFGPLFIGRWDARAPLDQTDLTKGPDDSQ
jgi:hypothetical protein